VTTPVADALRVLAKAQRLHAEALDALADAAERSAAPSTPEYLTTRQAEERGICGRRWLLTLLKTGTIPSYSHGRAVRVRTADLLEYLAAAKHAPKAPNATPVATTLPAFDPIDAALASGRFRLVKGAR
jgi:excisionase family DNA binding protein